MTILISDSSLVSFLKTFVLCISFSVIPTSGVLAANPGLLPVPQEVTESAIVSSSDSLFSAVMTGDTNLVRRLISKGVDLNSLDKKGWTPLDYATKRNRGAIRAMLLENGARTFPKTIPDMVEGPHVTVIDSLRFEVSVLRHDSGSGNSSVKRDTMRMSELPYNLGGYLIEPEDLDYSADHGPKESSWSDIRKIFVVGDVHGEYDRVAGLLTNNRIIDKDGNWNWGKGHLVFMGDIFDRGSKVTETLWLIIKLQQQAEKAGGEVHMVLGNHEPMIFKGDLRYITDEYYSLCDNLGLDYSDLFSEKTLLGHWVRQNPVMIRINQFVFIHGGVSPELYNARLPADTLNSVVWQYFNNTEVERNAEARSLILGNEGVLWYRGLADDGSRSEVIDDSTLNKALEFYGAEAFIIGHSEVDSIRTFLDKRVIDVNIPKADSTIREQGLLIKGRKIRVVYDDRKKRTL